ncbi:MAG TPA: ribonuclease P protein component [Rhodospirillaceae bacterium]|nr:ribonuclease P protein component [Rhodospirillaceae bacterium]
MPQTALISVLKKRSEFTAVSAVRKRFVTPGFIMQIAPRDPSLTPPIAYGLTTSKKMVSNLAVDRNRARRRLRALVQEYLPALGAPHTNYVFLARKEILSLPHATLRQDLEKAIQRLKL